ncbi:MAG: ABC transporter ATP-binding protein [Paracoccus sp. (in: a-proteobacteria)]|nr:ABC transporter ATP-binding protein [Paracoccus sp. (in: a-proteobacteria)]
MTQSLILSQLTKRFGEVRALSDVTLEVGRGERVALLGHNGAGKSTLMKIVLGLISYDSGSVDLGGAAPGSAEARRTTAYLPENAAFHPALSGRELVQYYLRLRGEPASGAGGLLERVGLLHAADRRISTYSKGMRQRVGLAQALIGQPRLMVLDEPTSGLDPVSRRDFYELIDGLAAGGASVLLSSHALTEVEARTDRLVILSRGRIVAGGTLASLRADAGLDLNLAVMPAGDGAETLRPLLPADAQLAPDGRITARIPASQKLALLARLSAPGLPVADIDVTPPSLEDIYTHYSRRDGNETAAPDSADLAEDAA